jgi:hypothetical protein
MRSQAIENMRTYAEILQIKDARSLPDNQLIAAVQAFVDTPEQPEQESKLSWLGRKAVAETHLRDVRNEGVE